jgi:hypothetical protein
VNTEVKDPSEIYNEAYMSKDTKRQLIETKIMSKFAADKDKKRWLHNIVLATKLLLATLACTLGLLSTIFGHQELTEASRSAAMFALTIYLLTDKTRFEK